MSPRMRRFSEQLVVVVPVVVASLVLSQRGVPPLRRLVTCAALGLILMSIMTVWRVMQAPRSQRR